MGAEPELFGREIHRRFDREQATLLTLYKVARFWNLGNHRR